VIDLTSLADEHLAIARDDPHGRSAVLVAHDGELRQTLIALAAGARLGEHNSPAAATLQVLVGGVRVEDATGVQADVAEGCLWVLTHERHSVVADDEAVFLLTTVTGVGRGTYA